MKQFRFILVCCVAVAISQEQTPDYFMKLESFKSDCISESHAKPDLVDKLIQLGEFNEDKDVKCYLKCLLVKMNVMNAEGEIQEAHMRSEVPPSADKGKVDMMVEKCKDLKGSDACDTAYVVTKCSYDVFTD